MNASGSRHAIRAKVEHPFRIIKRQFGCLKVRYRGLMTNTQQLHTLLDGARRILQQATTCVRSPHESRVSASAFMCFT
jgi:IS5 family transposase